MKTAEKTSFFKRILTYKGRLLLILLSNILAVFFTILSFLVLEPIVKILFQGNDDNLSFFGQLFAQIISFIGIEYSIINLIIVAILSMVLLYFFKNCFQYLSSWLMAKIRSGVVADLRNELYAKILALPLSFFSSQKKGDIISRAVNDVQEIELL
ncbi:MAG: hypothetical protein LBU51_02120, partial [Bacteroidales bacterium]|nr:hypothetical protein [Bacteroidales bacterium]